MKNILIIGAGWLGIPLGKKLQKKKDQVALIYRSESTKQRIELNGLHSISLDKTNWQELDIVILCFPPGINRQNYVNEIKKYVSKLTTKTHVILTSSTGIYPNTDGIFNEDVLFDVPQKKIHLEQAENIVFEHTNSTILRLGGLIGENRHPINYLSGKPLKNPDGPINLVHQEDVICVIESCIDKNWKGILNVVAPNNLTRYEFYSQAAKEKKLSSPIPIKSKKINRKIISKRLIEEFKYKFLKY